MERNNGVSPYGDTFLEGVVHNQKRNDARMVEALRKAHTFGESKEFIKGMIVALRVLRGDSYDEKAIVIERTLRSGR